MKVELARGEAEKKKLDAEADLYARTQRRGRRARRVQLAEAEGTRLENEALRGAGAENLVGLKMADVLQGDAASSSSPPTARAAPTRST